MPPLSGPINERLAAAVAEAANARGGWGYYRGKLSRIEPTCWALLAQPAPWTNAVEAHLRFLLGCQRSDGLLSDRPDLPPNLSWSALASITLSAASISEAVTFRERVLRALVRTGGLQLEDSPVFRQNNRLKGWPWVPDTFSWIEPTSWCLLALKRAARDARGGALDDITRRIAEGEAVLVDRACESGGWNFGNANAFGASLPAHIPTTALGLLALQDKGGSEVARRALAFIEQHWRRELSGTALALSLLCLRVYGRPTDAIEIALTEQWNKTRFLDNVATTSLACCALSRESSALRVLSLPS